MMTEKKIKCPACGTEGAVLTHEYGESSLLCYHCVPSDKNKVDFPELVSLPGVR